MILLIRIVDRCERYIRVCVCVLCVQLMKPLYKAMHTSCTIALVAASVLTLGIYSAYYLNRYTRIHLHTKGMTIRSSPFNNTFITKMMDSDMALMPQLRSIMLSRAGCSTPMSAPACECLHRLYSRQYSTAELSKVQKASLGCLLGNARPVEEEQLNPERDIHGVNLFTLVLVWNAISMVAAFIGPLAQMPLPRIVGGTLLICCALVPVMTLAYMVSKNQSCVIEFYILLTTLEQGELGSPSVMLYGIVVVYLSTAFYALLAVHCSKAHTSIDNDGNKMDKTMIVVHTQTIVYWVQYTVVLAISFSACNSVMGRSDATYHWVCVLFATAIGTATAAACLLNLSATPSSWSASFVVLACLLAPLSLYSLPFADKNYSTSTTHLHMSSAVWYATLLLLIVPQLEHFNHSSEQHVIATQVIFAHSPRPLTPSETATCFGLFPLTVQFLVCLLHM